MKRKKTRLSDTHSSDFTRPSQLFGAHVFTLEEMKTRLAPKVWKNIVDAMQLHCPVDLQYANEIAEAIKQWALDNEATHYTHWFQPMGGMSAQKHDSFLAFNDKHKPIEKFSGKQLLEGEPDASSFPSGGLRSTYEARGYTIWDPTSLPFIWQTKTTKTLCIPSLFFSSRGHVLDNKIALLRSEKKLRQAIKRLLKYFKIPHKSVCSQLGIEQEYFVVNRQQYLNRDDLVMLDKTVFGTAAAKGQELEDHYFSSIQEKVLSYMKDFEDRALLLGVPLKTRHNEVAPAQHEVAPIHENAPLAVDHNILLMELMRSVAEEHDLACIFHEKPFAKINGSGKHNNWSISYDDKINLFDPNNGLPLKIFITLLVLCIEAIDAHSKLIRAAVGSASNDYRLGGSEAPPAIISMYVGEELEIFLLQIEKKKISKKALNEKSKTKVKTSFEIPEENTDRNRTAFCAFTGNKLEFRGVGSSSNCAFFISVIQVAVADKIQALLDRLEKKSKKDVDQQLLDELSLCLKKSKRILYSKDNYSKEWIAEAERRGLENIKKSIDAYEVLKEEQTQEIFKDILSKEELESREEILTQSYAKALMIEANLMADLFQTKILPAALMHQEHTAKAIALLAEAQVPFQAEQAEYLRNLTQKISDAITCNKELEQTLNQADKLTYEAKARVLGELAFVKMQLFRKRVDELEEIVDDKLWPLPKYKELLFII